MAAETGIKEVREVWLDENLHAHDTFQLWMGQPAKGVSLLEMAEEESYGLGSIAFSANQHNTLLVRIEGVDERFRAVMDPLRQATRTNADVPVTHLAWGYVSIYGEPFLGWAVRVSDLGFRAIFPQGTWDDLAWAVRRGSDVWLGKKSISTGMLQTLQRNVTLEEVRQRHFFELSGWYSINGAYRDGIPCLLQDLKERHATDPGVDEILSLDWLS